MTPESAVPVLNDALKMCRSGQEGFAHAASVVSDAHLRKMFGEFAEQRGQFALQLQVLVRRLGGDYDSSGWICLKEGIAAGTQSAILDECARWEDAALQTYQEALAHELPSTARELLESQRMQIEEVRGQIAELRAHIGARPAAG